MDQKIDDMGNNLANKPENNLVSILANGENTEANPEEIKVSGSSESKEDAKADMKASTDIMPGMESKEAGPKVYTGESWVNNDSAKVATRDESAGVSNSAPESNNVNQTSFGSSTGRFGYTEKKEKENIEISHDTISHESTPSGSIFGSKEKNESRTSSNYEATNLQNQNGVSGISFGHGSGATGDRVYKDASDFTEIGRASCRERVLRLV